ncbi:MAG TPA: hypothetical protein VEF04_06300, partial [Blastocatellia bacterium]|nr:hypothetical protein [Blastocatellia bacterium]
PNPNPNPNPNHPVAHMLVNYMLIVPNHSVLIVYVHESAMTQFVLSFYVTVIASRTENHSHMRNERMLR